VPLGAVRRVQLDEMLDVEPGRSQEPEPLAVREYELVRLTRLFDASHASQRSLELLREPVLVCAEEGQRRPVQASMSGKSRAKLGLHASCGGELSRGCSTTVAPARARRRRSERRAAAELDRVEAGDVAENSSSASGTAHMPQDTSCSAHARRASASVNSALTFVQ
jgi:hypothetical protein